MQYENTKNSGESGVFKECSSDIIVMVLVSYIGSVLMCGKYRKS